VSATLPRDIQEAEQPRGRQDSPSSPSTSSGHHRTMVPRRGIQLFHVRELWDYRDVYIQFSKRDVTLRYRQTSLGIIWVILQPVIGAGIFAFVFGSIAHFKSDGVPYFVFAFSGLWIWNAFGTQIGNGSQWLLNYAPMLTKVYFPRVLGPLSVTTATVINQMVAFCMMIVLLFAYRIPFTWHFATFPLWLGLALLLAQGPALLFSSLMVRYRDIAYVQPVLINFLLFLSPVAYASSQVHKYAWIMKFNPLTGLLDGARWCLLGKGTLDPAQTIYSLATCVFFAVLGAFVFEQLERTFADVI
jgi:lipopolysaccharide transport system permease protein